MGNVFSVPIFIILLRETIEAAIIISVLLGLVESLFDDKKNEVEGEGLKIEPEEKKRLIRKMRLMVWGGALTGLLIAVAIGGAFIAVFFTTLSDLWSKSESIYEGTFSLIASLIIYVMGLTMLRIDRSKLKWKIKLRGAFDKKPAKGEEVNAVDKKTRREARGSKWSLFVLPLVTVLREGVEAVVFVAGISLGSSAKSIPLAAITGIVAGLVIGYLIYASGSRMNLSIFLVISTNVLFLLGAGLFSKAIGFFQIYVYQRGVGSDVAETGSGPGSFDPSYGTVWHLTYGNPEINTATDGYSVFNAILGWTNNANIGTILGYVAYWVACILGLVFLKWSEGRTTVLGLKSRAWHRRQERTVDGGVQSKSSEGDEEKKVETPIDEDRQFASHI